MNLSSFYPSFLEALAGTKSHLSIVDKIESDLGVIALEGAEKTQALADFFWLAGVEVFTTLWIFSYLEDF